MRYINPRHTCFNIASYPESFTFISPHLLSSMPVMPLYIHPRPPTNYAQGSEIQPTSSGRRSRKHSQLSHLDVGAPHMSYQDSQILGAQWRDDLSPEYTESRAKADRYNGNFTRRDNEMRIKDEVERAVRAREARQAKGTAAQPEQGLQSTVHSSSSHPYPWNGERSLQQPPRNMNRSVEDVASHSRPLPVHSGLRARERKTSLIEPPGYGRSGVPTAGNYLTIPSQHRIYSNRIPVGPPPPDPLFVGVGRSVDQGRVATQTAGSFGEGHGKSGRRSTVENLFSSIHKKAAIYLK